VSSIKIKKNAKTSIFLILAPKFGVIPWFSNKF